MFLESRIDSFALAQGPLKQMDGIALNGPGFW